MSRKKRNSSRINLTISAIFHTGLLLVLVFFAAREGVFGKKLKQITVTMVPKEKKPEPPKVKPPEPKVEPAKPAEAPKPAIAAAPPKVEAAPPPAAEPASVAPAAAAPPAFAFDDGAHQVQTANDPNAVYKGLIEHALRSHWARPEDMADEHFVAEADLHIDTEGNLAGYTWIKGSGNKRWDDTVRAALARTKVFSRPPPKGFPPAFVVRFDVESQRSESLVELSSR